MGFLSNLAGVVVGDPSTRAQDFAFIQDNRAQDAKRHQALVRRDRGPRIEAMNYIKRAIDNDEMLPFFTDTYTNPGEARAQFDKFTDDFNERLAGGGGESIITPEDIFKVGRTYEDRKSNLGRYLNDTDFSAAYLGEGKRFDAESSEIGINDLGELSITNPMVRTTDPDTGDTWTARYTQSGEREGDLAERGMLDGQTSEITFSALNQQYSEYYGNLADRANVDPTLSYMGGPMQFGGADDRQGMHDAAAAPYEEAGGALEQQKTDLAAQQTAIPKYDAVIDFAQGTNLFGRIDDLDPRTDDVLQFRKTGAEVYSYLSEAFGGLKGVGLGAADVLVTSTLPSAKLMYQVLEDTPALANFRKSADPNANAFNMDDAQWNNVTLLKNERARIAELSDQLHDYNVANEIKEVQTKLLSSSSGIREVKDPEGNIIANETVEEFYKTNKIEPDSNFYRAISHNKLLRDEFLDDPYQFAAKYADDTNEIYGEFVPTAVRSYLDEQGKEDINRPSAINAILSKDKQELETAIAGVRTNLATNAAKQQAIADYFESTAGNFGRADKEYRARIGLAFAASAPIGSDLYKSFVNTNALAIFTNTGQWSLASETLQNNMQATANRTSANELAIANFNREMNLAQTELTTGGKLFQNEIQGLTRVEDKETGQTVPFDITDAGALATVTSALAIRGPIVSQGWSQNGPYNGFAQPEQRNDYMHWAAEQMTMLKRYINEMDQPAWWQEILSLGQAQGGPLNLLEVGPNLTFYDKDSKPIENFEDMRAIAFLQVAGSDVKQIPADIIDHAFGPKALQALLQLSLDQKRGIDMSPISADVASLEL